MARQYIGLNRGTLQTLTDSNVSTGTSTTGADIEISYDTSKGLTREDFFLAVERFEYLLASTLAPSILPGL